MGRVRHIGRRLAATAVVLASCTGPADVATAPPSDVATAPPSDVATAPAPEAPATTDVPPAPASVVPTTADGFYDPPATLPPGGPGDVVAAEAIAAPDGTRAWRVLYRSTTVEGSPTAVSGWVAVPMTGDRHGVLVFAHGTTGLGDRCAPSLRGGATPHQFADLLADGWTVVATDYQGLGTPGLHHYLVADAAARSVLDGARAGARLDPSATLDTVALLGFSQGGHAVLAAAERAGELAPEVGLAGVVAVAPAFRLREWFAATPRGEEGYLLMMALGFADAFDTDPRDWLTDAALARRRELEEGCLAEALAVGSELGEAAFATSAGPDTPEGRLLDASEPGRVALPAPVLLVTGGADALVTPDLARDLVARLCDAGTDVARHDLPGASHAELSSLAREPVRRWLADPEVSEAPSGRSCGGPWP